MDFELSEEKKAFQKVIASFVSDHVRPVARSFEQSGEYPDEIVERMKAMGLFGVLVPEEYGGLGLDMVSLAVLFEELSKGWMGIAGVLGTHSLSSRMIAAHGTPSQKQAWLPRLATGEARTGVALTEPGAGSDLQAITTRAARDGDGYVVEGTKVWITNARHAAMLPVLAKTSSEPGSRAISVLLVPMDAPGVAVGRDMGKLGYRGPESCEILFDGVRVGGDALLGGTEGRGMAQVLSALEAGRINIAARAVGVAQAALDTALAYAKERHAFGKPIAEHQAIQLKLADMATEVQAARLMTWWAASCLDAGRRADKEAGMAKLFASEVAIRASLESMRVHGGYGYSTELDVERLYRDAPLMAIGEGTNEIQRLIIARSLLGE